MTLLHTGGEANNRPAIFAAYAGSGIWTAVRVAQFACIVIMLAGLLGLFSVLDVQAGTARMAGRLGVAATTATLALHGVVFGGGWGRAEAGGELVGHCSRRGEGRALRDR